MAPTTAFTPFFSILGGVLIGACAVMLMAFNGRIAGISGMISVLLKPGAHESRSEGALFLAGLVGGALIVRLMTGHIVQHVPTSLPQMAIAGALVGFGAVLGQGCTSGHGVCGLARLSPRSLVATLIFIAVAMLVTFLMRHGPAVS